MFGQLAKSHPWENGADFVGAAGLCVQMMPTCGIVGIERGFRMPKRKTKPKAQTVRVKGIKPTTKIGKAEARPIEILTPEEIRAVVALIPKRSSSGIRNLAALGLLYGAGLRASEALAVKRADLDLDALTIRVHRGKGGKARTVGLLPEVVPWIERWLDQRDRLVEKAERKARRLELEGDEGGADEARQVAEALRRGFRRGPLICTYTVGETVRGGGFVQPGDTRETSAAQPGSPMSDRYLRGWLAKLRDKALEAGITEKEHAFHPHSWRHAHADAARRLGGWDVEQVRKQLGHSGLGVTTRYLDKIGANELGEAMRGQSWGVGDNPEADEDEDRVAALERKVAELTAMLAEGQAPRVGVFRSVVRTTTRSARGKGKRKTVDPARKKR